MIINNVCGLALGVPFYFTVLECSLVLSITLYFTEPFSMLLALPWGASTHRHTHTHTNTTHSGLNPTHLKSIHRFASHKQTCHQSQGYVARFWGSRRFRGSRLWVSRFWWIVRRCSLGSQPVCHLQQRFHSRIAPEPDSVAPNSGGQSCTHKPKTILSHVWLKNIVSRVIPTTWAPSKT